MKRLPLGITVLGAFVVFSFIGPSGASTSCTNGQCVSAARLSLVGLVVGPVMLLCLTILPKATWEACEGPVDWVRRAVGFWVDVMVVGFGAGAFAVLPLLVAEGWYTGRFEWAYHRGFARPSDWVLMPLAIGLLCVAAWMWRRWQNGRGRPSVGQYLAGYAVVDGKPTRFRYARRATAPGEVRPE